MPRPLATLHEMLRYHRNNLERLERNRAPENSARRCVAETIRLLEAEQKRREALNAQPTLSLL